MDFDEDVHEEYEPQSIQDDDDWGKADARGRSPTPVYNDSIPKPRKRLVKKSSPSRDSVPVDFGLDDDDVGDSEDYGANDDGVPNLGRDDYSKSGKRKVDKGDKRRIVEKKRKGVEKVDRKLKLRKSGGGGRMRDHEADPEMKEMWDTVAGGNSEVRVVLM